MLSIPYLLVIESIVSLILGIALLRVIHFLDETKLLGFWLSWACFFACLASFVYLLIQIAQLSVGFMALLPTENERMILIVTAVCFGFLPIFMRRAQYLESCRRIYRK